MQSLEREQWLPPQGGAKEGIRNEFERQNGERLKWGEMMMMMQLGFVEEKLGFCDGKMKRANAVSLLCLCVCVGNILGTRKRRVYEQTAASLSLFFSKGRTTRFFLYIFCNT